MKSKDKILSEIRNSRRTPVDMPLIETVSPIVYEDRLKQFMTTVEIVGGHAVLLEEGADINQLLAELYPHVAVTASSLPYIEADLDPDGISEAYELDGTGLGVVEGKVAVAENGCVWVPQTMKERAVMFISENLAIIIDRTAIVNNMHEAYSMIEMSDYGYGCFISGPSKTADIAQALVMGAQAARDVTVIIR